VRGAYELLAMIRRRELPTRMVTAAALAIPIWIVDGTLFPPLWLGLVLASQYLDAQAYRRLGEAPSLSQRLAVGLSTLATSAAYSGLSVYLWTGDSEANRTLALLLLAGSLLHIAIHMHPVRWLLLVAAAPHAALFLGFPVSAALAGTPEMWAVMIGVVMFMSTLAVAVRRSSDTTRKLQEARAHAEHASAAKSDFLATISHEIRTPMNGIVSAANLLDASRLTRAQREQVEILKDANEMLLSLVNDVLDLSKIEAGKLEIEIADIELAKTLQTLQRLWAPRALEKGLELKLEVSPDAPLVARLDPLRTKQILFNLISNAVKFTRQGGVTVGLNVVERSGESWLRFQVSDTGIGIASDVLPRLFGAFEQASAGTTRVHGGTGLGLAISRRLAGLMGGTLDAASRPGEGSTFTLELPLIVSAVGALPADAQPLIARGMSDLAGARILVAEDHPVNQRVLELLLAPLNCRVTFCEDGAQAVDLVAREVFDVILMDMQMPVMDGLEASRRIRASDGGGPPIVALTANALDHHRAAWAAVGVHGFVSKPIAPNDLYAAVATAVASAPAANVRKHA
jgi:two-component system, sensor histidine kinase